MCYLGWDKGLEKIGQVGDAITGIVGTIIAFFGILLIYKAFIIQVEANRLLKTENRKIIEETQAIRVSELLGEHFRQFRDDVLGLEYHRTNKSLSGRRAIAKFVQSFANRAQSDSETAHIGSFFIDSSVDNSDFIRALARTLHQFSLLCEILQNSVMPRHDRALFKIRFSTLYTDIFRDPLTDLATAADCDKVRACINGPERHFKELKEILGYKEKLADLDSYLPLPEG